jgi:hypothetical protein
LRSYGSEFSSLKIYFTQKCFLASKLFERLRSETLDDIAQKFGFPALIPLERATKKKGAPPAAGLLFFKTKN